MLDARIVVHNTQRAAGTCSGGPPAARGVSQ
jgi:hypothetical protein